MFSCEQCRELLSPYLDEMVSAEERQQIEKHLAACPLCKEELQQLKQLQQLLMTGAQQPPREFSEGWRRAVRARKKFRIPLRSLGTVAAAAVLVVFAVQLPVFRANSGGQSAPQARAAAYDIATQDSAAMDCAESIEEATEETSEAGAAETPTEAPMPAAASALMLGGSLEEEIEEDSAAPEQESTSPDRKTSGSGEKNSTSIKKHEASSEAESAEELLDEAIAEAPVQQAPPQELPADEDQGAQPEEVEEDEIVEEEEAVEEEVMASLVSSIEIHVINPAELEAARSLMEQVLAELGVSSDGAGTTRPMNEWEAGRLMKVFSQELPGCQVTVSIIPGTPEKTEILLIEEQQKG
jgi:anti-sigma factor RsiW